MEEWFSLFNFLALAAWLLLMFFPNWKGTRQWVRSGKVSVALSIIYACLIVTHLESFGSGGFSSLAGVRALFRHNALLLAGWVHYLAFDLWVGVHLLGKSEQAALPRWLTNVILFFTFMLGPVGLLIFKSSELIWKKRRNR